MKIRRLEPIAIRLPLRRPVKMASEVVSAAQNVLVRLELADGTLGWGEAASAPTMTGETVASMARAVEQLAPSLTDTEDALTVLGRAVPGNSGAKAAIDIALHDAIGKATGKPVHALLGGAKRDDVALLWTLAGGDTRAEVAQARSQFAAGYRAFKIKVGIATPETDAERTVAICRELGSVLVCADANQGWSREEAIRYVRAVEGTSLAFLEQPVAQADVDGMAQVARASRVPIAVDEGMHGLEDIERHHAARVAGGSLKAIKLGGLRGLVRAAERCDELGMKVNLACKIAESGIAAAALLHAAAVVPALDWAVSATAHYLEQDLIATPLPMSNGRARVPRGAGLGIEVREDVVQRYRIPYLVRN